jgi:hypothetical protein
MRSILIVAVAALVVALLTATPFAARDVSKTTIVPGKAVMVSRQGLDCLYFAGSEYTDVTETKLKVRFRVEGLAVTEPVRKLLNGYWAQRIEITPAEGGAEVVVSRSLSGGTFGLSEAPTSDALPSRENVILVITQGTEEPLKGDPSRSIATDEDYPRMGVGGGYAEGKYRLPPFETKYKYSDILVSLNLQGADFREVLMFMSEISGVTIMLDPYWDDDPTGGRRRPGGPGSGELPPTESATPPGQFREAGVFQATIPREGIGSLTMNLVNVPFDLALDLILTSVNLEKIVIWPDGVE